MSNQIEKEKLIQWLKNKRKYAQSHLKSDSINESEIFNYASQNGLLAQIIDKIQLGIFDIK